MTHVIPKPLRLYRVLPPTGFALNPDLFVKPLSERPSGYRPEERVRCDDGYRPSTVEEHGGAVFIRPQRGGEAQRLLSEIEPQGQPIFFGPPEDPSPVGFTCGYPTPHTFAADIHAGVDPNCPTCQGRGFSYKLGGCHDCRIGWLSRNKWFVVGRTAERTWIRHASMTRKHARLTCRMFNESGGGRYTVHPRPVQGL